MLKGFKKIHSDQHSTTFAHDNGSRLTVPHSAMDKRMLQKVSKLPHYAGDEQKPEKSEVTFNPPPQEEPGMLEQFGNAIGEYGIAPAVKGVQALGQGAIDLAKSAGQFGGAITQGAEKGTGMYLPGSTAPGAPKPIAPVAEAAPAPTNVNLGAPQYAQPNPMAELYKNYNPARGLEQQMAGNTAEATAMGKVGREQAAAYDQNQKELTDLNSRMQQNAWNNRVETENMIQDMKNSHIDPNAYINNMSKGEKVGTAIGLLLGGLSQGLMKSNSNPAMDFLNKQIDRDVEAQKSSIENKKTIWNAMNQQFKNEQDANAMTKAFYLTKLQNDISSAAARNGGELAKARAQQVNGPIQAQIDQLHLEVGMRQAAMQGMNSGASAVNMIPFLVKDKGQQEKAIQAYGKMEELNKLHANMRQAIDEVRGKFMNGLLSPHDVESAEQSFAGPLMKLSEGRYTEQGAKNIIRSFFPRTLDAGKTPENKAERLDQFFDTFRAEPAAVLRSHYIPVPKAPPRFTKR